MSPESVGEIIAPTFFAAAHIPITNDRVSEGKLDMVTTAAMLQTLTAESKLNHIYQVRFSGCHYPFKYASKQGDLDWSPHTAR